MSKIKYKKFITKNDIDSIILDQYPDFKCPECNAKGVYAGCIEDQYDEIKDENVVISFSLFCNSCGAVLDKWDNTDHEYLFGKRKNY